VSRIQESSKYRIKTIKIEYPNTSKTLMGISMCTIYPLKMHTPSPKID